MCGKCETDNKINNVFNRRVEDAKARYPASLNIEGLEPAFTSDMKMIVQLTLSDILVEVFGLDTVKDPISRGGYDQAKLEVRHILKKYFLEI